MKWMILLCLTIAPSAHGEGLYYYCSTTSTFRATQYFSDVFAVPPGTNPLTVKNRFLSYLAVHYNESLGAKTLCFPSDDLRLAGIDQGKELLVYQNMRWRVVMTHWHF